MSILILLMVLFGAVLGMRFKVFILIPMIAITSLMVITGGLATGGSVSGTLIAVGLAASFLQFGYLGGALVRYGMVPARTGAGHKISPPVQSAL